MRTQVCLCFPVGGPGLPSVHIAAHFLLWGLQVCIGAPPQEVLRQTQRDTNTNTKQVGEEVKSGCCGRGK